MPDNENANQGHGPTNGEQSEEKEKEEVEEKEAQELKEHYEQSVDAALLGEMENDKESS
jgi:hypothetical protein